MYSVYLNENNNKFSIVEENTSNRNWITRLFKGSQEVETLEKLKTILDRHFTPEKGNYTELEILDKIKTTAAEIKERTPASSNIFLKALHIKSKSEKIEELNNYIQNFELNPLWTLPDEDALKEKAIEFGYQEGSKEAPQEYLKALFANISSFHKNGLLPENLKVYIEDGILDIEATLLGLRDCSDEEFDTIIFHPAFVKYPYLAQYLLPYAKDRSPIDLSLLSSNQVNEFYHRLMSAFKTDRRASLLLLHRLENLNVMGEFSIFLQRAIAAKDEELVQLLIDKKVAINQQLPHFAPGKRYLHFTPLHVAVEAGNLDAVRLLLEHEARYDMEIKEDPYYRYSSTLPTSRLTPFHLAILLHQFDIAQALLIEPQMDIDQKTDLTALQIVAAQGDTEAIEWLLNHRATEDEEALKLAVEHGHTKAVRVLAEHAKLDSSETNKLVTKARWNAIGKVCWAIFSAIED